MHSELEQGMHPRLILRERLVEGWPVGPCRAEAASTNIRPP